MNLGTLAASTPRGSAVRLDAKLWLAAAVTSTAFWGCVTATANDSGPAEFDAAPRSAGVSAAAPVFSPDGAFVAFVGAVEDDFAVYTVKTEGTDLARIAKLDGSPDLGPTFTPDGRIAFALRDGPGVALFAVAPDGSGRTRIAGFAGDANHPVFSPDGSRIAFTSGRAGSTEVYTMNADGSGLARVTRGGAYEPAFSPDGKTLVYVRDQPDAASGTGFDWELYVAALDGSGERALTDNAAHDRRPVYSPDGRTIAFERSQDGTYDGVFVMNADGSGQRRVSPDGVGSSAPAFSPDGERIAYVSEGTLYLADADGTKAAPLTPGPGARVKLP